MRFQKAIHFPISNVCMSTYLQELQSIVLIHCMTFIDAAEHAIQMWVVNQHVVYAAGADGSFYAASNSIYAVLQRIAGSMDSIAEVKTRQGLMQAENSCLVA